jgi:hypothetical protein
MVDHGPAMTSIKSQAFLAWLQKQKMKQLDGQSLMCYDGRVDSASWIFAANVF